MKRDDDCRNGDRLVLLEPREKPDVVKLAAQLNGALSQAHSLSLFDRMLLAHQARDCQWENKTPDGRRWKGGQQGSKEDVFPWPGAPDTEQRVADTICLEMTDLVMAAFSGADLQIYPRRLEAAEDGAHEQARAWRLVAAYYLDLCRREMDEQAEQFADTAAEYGSSLLRVGWRETRKLVPRTISAMEVDQAFQAAAVAAASAMAAQSGDEGLPEAEQLKVQEEAANQMALMLGDPEQRAALAELLLSIDPEMSEVESRRVAKTLQQGKQATYYATTIDESRPEWRALIPWVDCWFDPTVTKIESAPWVAEAEWLDETTLRERAATDGWDEKWLEEVLAANAGMSLDSTVMRTLPKWALAGHGVGLGVPEEVMTGTGEYKMWQVITVYYKAVSASGVPMSYRTVIHPMVRDSFAVHEPLTALKGRLPYVDLREGAKRALCLNRGIPEICAAVQVEIKSYHDSSAAQTQLRAAPPMEEPAGSLGGGLTIRPGARLPAHRAGVQGGHHFLQVPDVGAEFLQLEMRTRGLLDQYFGRGESSDPDIKLARRRRRASRFLLAMQEAVRLTFLLIQENTDDIEAATIAGVPVKLNVKRADIQGDFDLSLKFDVADLDLATVGKRLEFIQRLLLPLDSEGVINRAELVRAGARMIAPDLADRVVMPTEAVQQSEIDDEDTALAKMRAGIEPPFLQGKNHRLRAERMAENMGKSPSLQMAYQHDEVFKALFDNRLKMHRFQTQQQENAIIGRVGGEQVLG